MAANPIFEGASWFIVTSNTQVWPLDGQGGTITTRAGSDVEDAEEVQFLGFALGERPNSTTDFEVYRTVSSDGDTVAFEVEIVSNDLNDSREIPVPGGRGAKILSDISAAWAASITSGHAYVFYRVVKRTAAS